VLASALGFALNLWIDPAALANWGWRIPFFVGCMIIPFIFIVRRSLQETEESRTSSGCRSAAPFPIAWAASHC
jgi:MFS transporter, MHS family, citrate/tricarballylate:H+ symporter